MKIVLCGIHGAYRFAADATVFFNKSQISCFANFFYYSVYRGEIGHWLAFILVVLRLFFHENIPSEPLMLPALVWVVRYSFLLLEWTICSWSNGFDSWVVDELLVHDGQCRRCSFCLLVDAQLALLIDDLILLLHLRRLTRPRVFVCRRAGISGSFAADRGHSTKPSGWAKVCRSNNATFLGKGSRCLISVQIDVRIPRERNAQDMSARFTNGSG
jgi:hypothetical protein